MKKSLLYEVFTIITFARFFCTFFISLSFKNNWDSNPARTIMKIGSLYCLHQSKMHMACDGINMKCVFVFYESLGFYICCSYRRI